MITKMTDLVGQCLQAGNEAIPEVSKKRSVNLFETFLGAGIHTDVQLGHWSQVPDNTGLVSQLF